MRRLGIPETRVIPASHPYTNAIGRNRHRQGSPRTVSGGGCATRMKRIARCWSRPRIRRARSWIIWSRRQ